MENTPQAQWGKLWLLSMEGKAFVWQRHYTTHNNNKMKSWQQILQDVALRFDMGNYDDPVSELSKLRQEGTLFDYFEKFDQLLS